MTEDKLAMAILQEVLRVFPGKPLGECLELIRKMLLGLPGTPEYPASERLLDALCAMEAQA